MNTASSAGGSSEQTESPPAAAPAAAPSSGGRLADGLLLVQIDGLAQPQFEHALRRGNLPFIHSLRRRRGYRTLAHYSGLPSATPAVQGELFFGVKCAVPAFSFFDRSVQGVVRMYGPSSVRRIEDQLETQGDPLLRDGSSYANTYSGGAARSHFCAPDLGWSTTKTPRSRWHLVRSLRLRSLARLITLVIIEFGIAFGDFFRGLFHGQSLWKELKFIPTRAGIVIGLRELIVAGASQDLTGGLPIVHVNFLGYDEQAHRRGPSSAFAHWTLRGIDDAVRRLTLAAERSSLRRYQVWVFSDHGQCEVMPFSQWSDRTLQSVVDEVAAVSAAAATDAALAAASVEPGFPRRARRTIQRPIEEVVPVNPVSRLLVTAMGPIGHLYDLDQAHSADRKRVARELVRRGVPVVLFVDSAGDTWAITTLDAYILPRDATEIFGEHHPFLQDVTRDLIDLVKHPHAGEWVLAGWHHRQRPVSFPEENGSHAGFSPDEVAGFILFPPQAPLPNTVKGYVRPQQLRQAIRQLLSETGNRRSTGSSA